MTGARGAERILMVKAQLKRRGIRDERVLDAFGSVPREEFVRPEDRHKAYFDEPLKIGCGQTISQPYIVALTCQALEISPDNRALEIGTGSGYETAVLARLCREVISVERIPELADSAAERLRELGAENVKILLRDGTLGIPEYSPYDAIAVTAAAPSIPETLADQLVDGGRMVIPIGNRVLQELLLFRKSSSGLSRMKLCDCRFVSLIGCHGFADPEMS